MAKIAHQIREQLEYYRKNYQLNAKTETVNRPDGNARNESDSGTNMM